MASEQLVPTTRLAWLPAFATALLLACSQSYTYGQTPDPSRDQQIRDIRKQLEELNRKLDALTKPGAADSKPAADATLTPGAEWLKPMTWRSIGPANMGGRIVAISVYEADPSTYWIATASGGLLKTVNNGVTFEHQFDREATVSIGDVAVAPSNKDIVWVGTGEANPRNSVSYGDGVYKSTDGGKTWTNMGLKDSYQIGRIIVHPTNPDIVYVGALGRLYGPSPERGLFKTTDGGKTWQKILFVDDRTGVIDLRMHPANPDTLIVATYERLRDLYDSGDPIQKFGAGSGLHKTTDGGKSFTKLTRGLPAVKLGRVGLDYYRKDPNTVYAIIESEKIGTGPRPAFVGVSGPERDSEKARIEQVVADGPAAKGGVKTGDVITEADGKAIATYAEFVAMLRRKKAGDPLKLKLEREGKPVEAQVTLAARPSNARSNPPSPGGGNREGVAGLGLNVDRPFGVVLGGQAENRQEEQGADGYQTGGVYKSTDGGDSWNRINSINPRPFYFSQIRVDPSDDKYLYVLGLTVHRSTDGGKEFRGDGGRNVHADHHALWIDPRDGRHLLLGGDGGLYVSYDRASNWDHFNHMAIGQFYHVAIDTRRPYRVYGGLQDNGSWGGPTLTRSGDGPINEDWVNVGGGDGFHCQVDPSDPDLIYSSSQYGVLSRRNLRTGEFAPIRPVAEKDRTHRFNWNTPFLLSSHNPKIYYVAGEVVFRSLNQGDDLRPISPEITRTREGTATAVAESPRDPNVLYVGTDDGLLWISTNGGKDWTDLTKKVGLDRPCYVATIEASREAAGRAYVVFDGHRSDTDDPLVYVTEDFGQTWKSLRANLPRGSSRCLREDLVNPNLLYLGTEFGIWASLDRGASWVKINANLPTVAVHEVAIHPTAGEIVAATHGRSLWTLDVSALRQLTRETMKAKATLLKPVSAIRFHREAGRGGTNRRFVGQNPPRGAAIYVALGEKPEKAALKILDYDGTTVYESNLTTEPGLHRVAWSMTRPAPRPERPESGGGILGQAVRGLLRRGQSVPALPGTYKVVLVVDGKESSQPLKLEADPAYPNLDITSELLQEAFDHDSDDDDDADHDDDDDRDRDRDRIHDQ